MKRVIFVCVENSCRSQMAEGFARLHGGAALEALSAGSRPSGQVNPRAIQFMAERDYDLSRHESKALPAVGAAPYDAVITMGCGDVCPWLAAERHEDWGLPDPKNLSDAEFRAIRDRIETRVLELLRDLGLAVQTSGRP